MPRRTPRKPRLYCAHETERMKELDGAELASFRSRAIALTIDFAMAGALFMVVMLGLGKLTDLAGWKSDRHIELELNFFHNWYSVAYLVLFFGVSFYLGNGQTLGKRLMGIRAVSLVHHRLSLWHSIERAFGYGASALEFGFGFLQYYIHPNRRAVHDRIAETIVIRESRATRALRG
jgi:uncharacterized RDD family membrane protein YckC